MNPPGVPAERPGRLGPVGRVGRLGRSARPGRSGWSVGSAWSPGLTGQDFGYEHRGNYTGAYLRWTRHIRTAGRKTDRERWSSPPGRGWQALRVEHGVRGPRLRGAASPHDYALTDLPAQIAREATND